MSEPLWRELAAFWREQAGADSPQYAGALAALGLNLLEQQKPADPGAPGLLRECLLIREKTEPDAWTTFHTQSLLGISLLGQKNYSAAEPLLLSGYAGMKEREGKLRSQGKARLTDSLDRLIQLYDAWDKPDQAAEWRAKLPEPAKP